MEAIKNATQNLKDKTKKILKKDGSIDDDGGPAALMRAELLNYNIRTEFNRDLATDSSSTLGAPSLPGHYERIAGWLTPGHYLCIRVCEARNLCSHDFDTLSSDPYVKIQVGRPGERQGTLEFRTRTVHRNRSPMFQESFFFPLQDQALNSVARVAMYDSDLITDEFMGHIQATLVQLLEPVEALNTPLVQWFPLAPRRPTDIAGGDLLLMVAVLDEAAYEAAGKDRWEGMSAGALQQRFGSRLLQVHLRGVKQLRITGDAAAINGVMNNLSFEFRIGQSVAVQAVKAQQVVVSDPPAGSDGGAGAPAGAAGSKVLSLELDDKVLLPLADAFRGRWSSKGQSEVGDLKIYLRSGKEQLSKTQIPIWDVPMQGIPAAPLSAPALPSRPPSSALVAASGGSNASMTGTSAPPGTTPARGGSISSSAGATAAAAGQQGGGKERDSNPSAKGGFFSGLLGGDGCKAEGKAAGGGKEGAPAAAATDATANEARCYRRPMEPYSKSVVGLLELDVELLLVTKAAGPAAEVAVLDDDEDEEDVADVKSLPLPPALEVVCVEEVLNAGPNKLYATLVKAESEFMKKMQASEGLRDVSVGSWSLDPASKARRRTVTYVKPLSLPIPMAPKEAAVTDVQTLVSKEAGGWVLEGQVSTSAPKGDAFYVQSQIAVAAEGGGRSKIRVSMKVVFTKSVGFLKGAIEGGAQKDTKRYLQVLLAALKRHTGQADGAGAAAAGGAAGDGAAGVAGAAAGADGGALAASRGGIIGSSRALQLFLALLVLGLLLLALGVWVVGERVADALEALAIAAIKQAEAAAEAAAAARGQCEQQMMS